MCHCSGPNHARKGTVGSVCFKTEELAQNEPFAVMQRPRGARLALEFHLVGHAVTGLTGVTALGAQLSPHLAGSPPSHLWKGPGRATQCPVVVHLAPPEPNSVSTRPVTSLNWAWGKRSLTRCCTRTLRPQSQMPPASLALGLCSTWD